MQHSICEKGACNDLMNVCSQQNRDPSLRRIPLLVWNGLRERAPTLSDLFDQKYSDGAYLALLQGNISDQEELK